MPRRDPRRRVLRAGEVQHRARLRRGEDEPSEVLHIGDVTIDVPAHTVTRDGTPIPLTPLEFDLLVVDVNMPQMDGITLLKHLNSAPNPPTFLAVTAFDSDDTMLKILRAGGAGYILKNQRPRSIIEAVREAMEGGTVVAPAAMHRLVDYIGQPAAPLGVGPGAVRTTRKCRPRA